jgi:hypothetical protein
MDVVTLFEKTLAAAQEHIKTTLIDYQRVIRTDKQQEFELKSTTDLVCKLIEGLTNEPGAKISALIETIEKVAQNSLPTDFEPQDERLN